ncbi:glycosyltransferase family 2 protein [Aliivibrio sifiae]|uniref:Glycosyltransferase 2-like domain-containing protein n=1 Tax=Aliivibrio sifiae TaxID=566293 RepID=A0A2S7X0I2_9GAMM|nr:glycosyltransferase family 2 protein [Aliivibrio sifiae]PQJ83337.1 hypothetical protein BTO22_18285 [Aliivibrio sifiae]
MKLSIVTTVFKSSRFIDEFYNRISKSIEALLLSNDCEIIFVNDGSPDDSLDKLKRLSEQDARIKVINLTRNFGHHAAIMAGLNHCVGKHIYLTDIDLEEPPECLVEFYREINEKHNMDADVIYGTQAIRSGKGLKKYGGKIFYRLFKSLSNVDIDDNVMTLRIMTSRYVSALLLHNEKELYLAGLFAITGFNQVARKVEKKSRGDTSYTALKRVRLFVQAIASFSSLPLVLCFYLGGTFSFLSFVYSFYLGIRIFSGTYILEGWTSLIISIWFLSGIILMALGILGIYISKIFNEVKNRPTYLVKEIYAKK